MLDANDIQRLLTSEIRERKDLEYKRELNIDDNRDKNKQEFLCDIASFYNTDGGCIIFGIEEKKNSQGKNTGIPSSLYDQKIDNPDALILKLHDIIKSGTEPAITNISIKCINVDGIHVLVLGIGRGLGLPSMVIHNEINKFYRRNSSAKYAVDVYELNQMFMENQSVMEAAETFKAQRVQRIMANGAIPNLNLNGAFFVHTIPLSFQRNSYISLSRLRDEEISEATDPLWVHTKFNTPGKGIQSQFNYDGFIKFNEANSNSHIFAYNQFFRNGIIEFYYNQFYIQKANNSIDADYVFGTHLISGIIQAIRKASDVFAHLEIEPPFLSFITLRMPNVLLTGINTYIEGKLQQGSIDLPGIYIDRHDYLATDLYPILKNYIDIIWQSAGKEGAPTKEAFFNPNSRI